ncbi:cysteine-rich receptor-like protein kinase 11 [Brassica napus]|uniref:cysteine-rich receptor-like protein kinase 11 n=1 Tax=Brassica napus TaxID=3708 RepID=UPI00207A88C8|nr:cysteine-rich receptor-like protein kinase 11 [Brassica napus]
MFRVIANTTVVVENGIDVVVETETRLVEAKETHMVVAPMEAVDMAEAVGIASLIEGYGQANILLPKALVCWNNRVFTPNDTYDANRRLILSYLPSNVTAQNGLNYNSSIGQEPNRIYATGMCIPGSDLVECSECIRTTSDALIQRCQNRTEAYAWPHDPTLCYVRYSNTSFLGSLDLNPRANLTNGANVTSDLTEFRKIWEDLAVRMIDAASTSNSTPSSSDNYYTANTAALNPFQEIYALMQCTPDLSSSDCKTCLRESVRHYRDRRCCNTRQGTRVWRPSCYFRMEMYTFSKASFVNFSSASPPPHADDQGSKINNGKFSN